jgi:RimJ/RimL family protein N-acetyltransferase
VLIGSDRQGIAAISIIDEVDGPGHVELSHMAISRRFRGKGGGHADEMMTKTLDVITSRAFEQGVTFTQVYGYIHPLNHASQSLFRRAGLRRTHDETPDLQQWGRDLILTTDDEF